MYTDPFFSIIIPVYNVSNYLRTCLDSIIVQEVTCLIEIILVDDGSTDDSGKICDEYAILDDRISVIHTKNKGAADARNVGIKASKGKHLLFIDSDDYIINGSLEGIMTFIKTNGDCDVILLNADSVYPNGKVKEWSCRYSKKLIYKKARKDVLKYFVRLSRIPISPCIKLLNRDFVLVNKLFFTSGIACEDVDHTYKVLCNAKTFNYCDLPYYCARFHREDSSMNNKKFTIKRFCSTYYIIYKWTNLAYKNPTWESTILGFLAIQYLYMAAMYHDIPESEKVKHYREVKNMSWILRYGVNWKFKIIRFLFSIFKLRLFSLIFRKLLL